MSGRRRKKKHAEHVNHERWLVSYADFITLLFAFFVVMFASSQVDEQKVGKLATAVQVAFDELGIFTASNTRVPLSDTEPLPFSEVQTIENVARTATLGRVVSATEGEMTAGAPLSEVSELSRALEEALAPEISRQEVTVETQGASVLLRLQEIGFFDSGAAAVRLESEDSLERIATILASHEHEIQIEGHTDNVPIHTARFDSNWELSTARSTALAKTFITRYGIPPERLSAAGYAEFRPVAPNDTVEGRAMNRRVDIILRGPSSRSRPGAG